MNRWILLFDLGLSWAGALKASLEELQSSPLDVSTTFGASLPDWKLDTSREYWLSRNGLWNADAPPTTRIYNFEISNVVGWPDGVVKNLTVINGKFPGPVIECNEGDTLVINVINRANDATSLHWHGLYQYKTPHMDGVAGITQCPIPPGRNYTYNFTVEQYGTYWYHSHYGTQYMEGVYGPLIVHSKREEKLYPSGQTYTQELVMFLSDWYHDSTAKLLEQYLAPGNENSEPVPDNGLIQGHGYFKCDKLNRCQYNCSDSGFPVVPVMANQNYRLRVINAGAFSEIDFSIDEHALTVIEGDGTNVDRLSLFVLRIAQAQRYSVLISTGPDTGQLFWMRATLNSNCYDASNPILDTDVRGIWSYPSGTREMRAHNGGLQSTPKTLKSTQLWRCQLRRAQPHPARSERAPRTSQSGRDLSTGYVFHDRRAIGGQSVL